MNNYKFSSEMRDAELTTQDEIIEKVEKKELKTKIEPKIEPKKEPKKEPVIKTTTTLLNVREKPSKNSNIMNVLEKGTKVAVVENIGEWSKLLDNTFVMSEYLK
ncbi:MAG: SH3 domain-containing protein [Clostridiales bacterium]|uniref:SH3 domain-containing protein n=1 Tax=Terrisporobacter sp. TaxID=1965305 RepID=UPI002A517997|nr:SH3 domain-containing protein [Terrisporobacter sp.]MDD7755052.1 SH3 domain-containing protein [Clostridiales bacterium]MDY4137203.1 SH3 domain-containing protein [Terrisporobacter sp.]